MQNIVIDQPYRFVPPHCGRFWCALFGLWLPRYLDRNHGIESVECRGTEHLQRSLDAGHGILLTSNHCRPCDPMTLGVLSLAVRRPFYIMASWHLFRQSRFQTWLLPRIGAFSVYREGLDREALKTAVGILNDAVRPLVLFPEGVVSRTNDRLNNLMEGTAFIAHTAAKQRAAATPAGQVVVHPVAIRYLFRGDPEAALTPMLEEIEARFSWRPPPLGRLRERINRVGEALLCLKELEYLGRPQTGEVPERLGRLINCLLQPLEKEWLKGEGDGDVVARVKKLRMAILPDLVSGEIDEAERARRWRQLADLYLAQQLSCYPPDYIRSRPTPERLLETVERFEEDLTDRTRIHRPLHAIIEVGEALPVSPVRERGGGPDPLMEKIRGQLEAMLERSGRETAPLAENSP
ncbi:MAG: 1-acyl-sn-glycerol-3-phosphate acyltransferase [Verrucomicrobiota bacterium]|jgi:1-acyl-sn-glycerol-3-phosphate acyltransferase